MVLLIIVDYSMAHENKSDILIRDFDPAETSFEVVLDMTCDRLREKHVQFNIRRIREMDEELKKLEEELDEFLGPCHG